MKVALACPGLGRAFRGYERFAAELFEALGSLADITLFSGGTTGTKHVAVGGAKRQGAVARALGALSHDVYYWEAVTFAALAWRRLRRFDLLHYSEPPLNLAFTRLEGRRQNVKPRLFSHALNMDARHTLRCHHIHQTSPESLDAARRIGVPDDRMTLLPYGLFTDRFPPVADAAARRLAKAALGVPQDKPVVLSVVALNRHHKRVDKLIAAIAGLAERPHLIVCGAIEDASLLEEAKRSLGTENFTHAYVSNDRMSSVFSAADIFVMPSLNEGFGLAVVEAQLSGLSAVVHDSPHFRWLLADASARFTDMSSVENMSSALREALIEIDPARERTLSSRAEYVKRYDWKNLAPQYVAMYSRAAAQSPSLIESLVAS